MGLKEFGVKDWVWWVEIGVVEYGFGHWFGDRGPVGVWVENLSEISHELPLLLGIEGLVKSTQIYQ